MTSIINTQVQGVFTLTKGNINTGTTEELTTFNNLVLNNGLNLLFTAYLWDIFGYSYIGAGTGEPLVTDTSLSNYKFGSAYRNSALNGNYQGIYRFSRFTYRFNPNIAGTYTEIGIGIASNSLFSKSLIKDSNGNPISITLLSDEYLDVTYEVRFYINTSTSTITNFNLGKSIHTLNIKPAYLNSTEYFDSPFSNIFMYSGGDFGLFSGPVSPDTTGGPSGTGAFKSSYVFNPYVNNSFERTVRYIFNLNSQANNWPIKSIFANYGIFGLFQTEVIPDIIKTSSEVLTLDVKLSIGRYTGAG